MNELDIALDIERSRKGPARTHTAVAAQRFAAAIDPDAPFEVLAFSHLLLTQATLSWNEDTFGLYLRVAFDERDYFDTETVSAYFDLTCPDVRDTRRWLTPPRAAGAIVAPAEREGLPEGWETVPDEDIRGSFTGDLRSLPVGEFTLLLVRYPDFEHGGFEFQHITTSWVTQSTEPAQAHLHLGWLFDGDELPFDVAQAVVAGPDGTRYPGEPERLFVEPGFVEFVFVLDFIPESLEGVGFAVLPDS